MKGADTPGLLEEDVVSDFELSDNEDISSNSSGSEISTSTPPKRDAFHLSASVKQVTVTLVAQLKSFTGRLLRRVIFRPNSIFVIQKRKDQSISHPHL